MAATPRQRIRPRREGSPELPATLSGAQPAACFVLPSLFQRAVGTAPAQWGVTCNGRFLLHSSFACRPLPVQIAGWKPINDVTGNNRKETTENSKFIESPVARHPSPPFTCLVLDDDAGLASM